jgi:acyl-CoA reductase-like NAD-dependent aldehyde dehydrogenase
MIGFNQGIVSNAGAPFGGVKQSGYGREHLLEVARRADALARD